MKRSLPRSKRKAAVLILAAVSIIFMLALVAFAVDMGYVVLVRTQLQAAADSAAIAAATQLGKDKGELFQVAKEYAEYHVAGGQQVSLLPDDVELGVWDSDTRTFMPNSAGGNAVRVTTRRDARHGGEAPLFFAKALDLNSFTMEARAVAIGNPRDICFVVDLSGSMNDDTEGAWATDVINDEFAAQGYGTIGTQLMQDIYADFGFGAYPGRLEYIGEPFGVPKNSYAYAELTKDGGVLTRNNVPSRYRIRKGDSELVRKQKAYSAIIDYQLAKLMPAAKPTPDSRTNYAYWEKYLDYVIRPKRISSSSGGGSKKSPPKKKGGSSKKSSPPKSSPPKRPSPPKPPTGRWIPEANPASLFAEAGVSHAFGLHPDGTIGHGWNAVFLGTTCAVSADWFFGAYGSPPYNRGYLPPRQDSDRIYRFNNPNRTTFPGASSQLVYRYLNQVGYLTYVQFMLDHGRDLKPDGRNYVPLSQYSPHCPWHSESTAGGTFSFPPREQPMHAARRALIAAIQVIKERNEAIRNPDQRDWVSIVTFDVLSGGGPVVVQPLTGDYRSAMVRCTTLQACGDKGASTATEAGLIAAREHLKPKSEGGFGREATNKIVVLLTDGVPNLYVSPPSEIDQFIGNNPNPDFYNNGAYWYDAALMQAMEIQLDNWQLFPVGVGLGTDYDFMDRMARMGATANDDGQSPRGSGNPAEYEQRLSEIFRRIIESPRVRLVQ